jgi:hypothetical protein
VLDHGALDLRFGLGAAGGQCGAWLVPSCRDLHKPLGDGVEPFLLLGRRHRAPRRHVGDELMLTRVEPVGEIALDACSLPKQWRNRWMMGRGSRRWLVEAELGFQPSGRHALQSTNADCLDLT